MKIKLMLIGIITLFVGSTLLPLSYAQIPSYSESTINLLRNSNNNQVINISDEPKPLGTYHWSYAVLLGSVLYTDYKIGFTIPFKDKYIMSNVYVKGVVYDDNPYGLGAGKFYRPMKCFPPGTNVEVSCRILIGDPFCMYGPDNRFYLGESIGFGVTIKEL
jgi:hypothetical protein